MKLAITTWNQRVSPVLDVARQAEQYQLVADTLVKGDPVALPGTDLEQQASALLALQVDVLVCGAISRPMARLLATSGLQIIPFIAGEIETVLDAWRRGVLPTAALRMPGCHGRQFGWCGGGRRQGRGRWRLRSAPPI